VRGGTALVMVETDQAEVERRLRDGGLCCPYCGGALARWGHARERSIRGIGHLVARIRPRRSRCSGCGRSHVLLPTSCLLRRADAAAAIGAALTAKADGLGHRRIAERLGRPASTVRNWLRAFAARAEHVRAGFTALLHELDPVSEPLAPAGTAFADAVSAVGAAAAASRRRFGAVMVAWSPWQVAAAVSGGRLLAPAPTAETINTSWLWAAAS
jgi:Homeodomain-like domain